MSILDISHSSISHFSPSSSIFTCHMASSDASMPPSSHPNDGTTAPGPSSTIVLANGAEMPVVGFGLYLIPEEEAEAATATALSVGYRHLDSASFYGNEEGVGKAIQASGIPREELFIATKVWTDCIGLGCDAVTHSVLVSLERLKLEYVDIVYVHWPVPGKHIEAYKALEALVDEGKVRALGLSNYRIEDYEELVASGIRVDPVVNQIEANPFLYRKDTIDFFRSKNMQIVAYKPLLRGKAVTDSTVIELSEKYKATPAQILLRWGIQHGFAVLPKSSNPDRIASNLELFSFSISDEDMKRLDGLTTQASLTGFQSHFEKRAAVDDAGPTLKNYAPPGLSPLEAALSALES